ncbi:hypothetical protein ZYGR_0H00670 [Zygosaccharomyces rouxii]|uniref:ZYRO0B05522p n=2 Tax=Zygosaccharomyces rouxii TaxID=4956 RepID=C5DR48_ZYGRC|nr:uncharacterized protein ZYRO0B05522g [Zygosaccharomyces rouxii]KAH9200195.1 hypothetical protein LQ764DRAFT_225098 [Zygosaccharomyces rouxii]GAV47226.1 hypothetical protein ZYGR_0H00670 [Zygosaccharomyces rouxii]CAR26259.1 ZYRO0B05522p [Zygosaccharomyces rouxii]
MDFDHAVTSLIGLLRNGIPQDGSVLLNNLVYYTPRLRNVRSLENLIRSTFESYVWANKDLFELYEMSQAIVQWKLEISEPTISLQEFYSAWDLCFANCNAWTPQKLAILGGILSTKSKFEYLQRNHFLDDSGIVIKLYGYWRNEYFLPVWCSLIGKSQPLSRLDELVAIYSTISDPIDVKKNQVPWDTVTWSLTRLSTNYLASPPFGDSPSTRHLNQFVKTLQISIERNNQLVISGALGALCRECFNLCAREAGSSNPNKNYMGEYYRNILFAVIIELKSILDATRRIPENWYPQIIMCLFFTSFIAKDIGIVGFESYEYVYDVVTTGITICPNRWVYMQVLDTMIGNVWNGIPIRSNKPNDAKRLFMLNYMERTLPEFSHLTPNFIEHVIRPLELSYIDSQDVEVRESVHLVLLSLFQNSISGDNLLTWQAHHYHEYVALATEHFLQNKLSEAQLAIVYQGMASRLPLLQVVDRHLTRNTLHYTYLKILNCPQVDQQRVLLLCLIYQFPYVDKIFLVDWFNTCKELMSKIKFDKAQNRQILEALWKVVSGTKSDDALKWWYGNIVPTKSYL